MRKFRGCESSLGAERARAGQSMATAARIGACILLLSWADPGFPAIYRNPLYRDVADPFVLKHRGEYYLYRTEVRGVLDVLTSRDLVHWRQGPVVWRPASADAPNGHHIWAPEAFYEDGRFYLYFSAGSRRDDKQLWRAVADSPLGPFHLDPEVSLTEPWRIDVNMFRDDDGSRYLYSCHRGQLDSGAYGAQVEGLQVTSVAGRLPGEWLPMVTPQASWEGIWVEGPTVLKDRSSYYMLYSGPDAESPNYQVGYATAARPLGPWKKQGVLIPSLPGVPGPGHQCVVLAPDNLTPYLLYHRKRLAERGWNRDLMLDRLWMSKGRLATRAPTTDVQAAPPHPAFEDHFDHPSWRRSWLTGSGDWRTDLRRHELLQGQPRASGTARLKNLRLRDGVIEINLRRTSGDGGVGLTLVGAEDRLPILLFPEGKRTLCIGSQQVDLPADADDPAVDHQLLLFRRGAKVEARLDGLRLGDAAFAEGAVALELATQRAAAAFSGVAVTPYADPLPLAPPGAAATTWRRTGDRIEQRSLGATIQRLRVAAVLRMEGRLTVEIQGWALGTSLPVRKYGLKLETPDGQERFEAYIDPANGVLATHGHVDRRELPWQNSDLPLRFDYTAPHRLTIARNGSDWRVTVDGQHARQRRRAAIKGSVRAMLVTEDARASFGRIKIANHRRR
jgi:GH43 family beta-xylosidase